MQHDNLHCTEKKGYVSGKWIRVLNMNSDSFTRGKDECFAGWSELVSEGS